MLLVQQEQVNEHVDYLHKKLMHIAVVFHLMMMVNYHQYVDDSVDADVVDYQDYVPMVKHKKLLVVAVLNQQEDLDHNDQEFFSTEMVNLRIKCK
jgi:ribonucleotide reductase alpha subunit